MLEKRMIFSSFFLHPSVRSMLVKYLPTSRRQWTLNTAAAWCARCSAIVSHRRLVLWLSRLLLLNCRVACLSARHSHYTLYKHKLHSNYAAIAIMVARRFGGWQRLHSIETKQLSHAWRSRESHNPCSTQNLYSFTATETVTVTGNYGPTGDMYLAPKCHSIFV